MRLPALVLLLGLVACQPKAPTPAGGVVDDSAQTHRRTIEVPEQNAEIEVLFGDEQAFVCEGKRVTTKELFERREVSSLYRSGFYFIDVDQQDSSYRAYFKKEHLLGPSQAIYIFCSGSGSELTGVGCALAGVTDRNCFESYVAQASTIEFFDDAISELHRSTLNDLR